MLPEDLKNFWDRFNDWFLGPDLAQSVLDSFNKSLHTRFGERKSWPVVSVESQLIRHQAGYFLKPHSDLHTKLIVLLLYLAPDDSAVHLKPRFTARRIPTLPILIIPIIRSRISSE